jgi:hypothetical protein
MPRQPERHFEYGGFLAASALMPKIISIEANINMSTDDKIASFAELPEGWDYGKGAPIPQETLESAFAWNSFLRAHNFFETDAFPGSDGEVVVATGYGNHYLEIIIEPDGRISVAYDVKGKQEQYFPNLSLSDALTALLKIVGQIWNVSAYYTQINSTGEQASSLGLHFETQNRTGVYRWLGWNVLNSPQQPSAPISDNTTWESQESLETHPSFGSLNPPHFLRVTG